MRSISKYFHYILVFIFIYGCSNDDDLNTDEGLNNAMISDVIAISQDQSNILQINVSDNGDLVVEENLSELLSLDNTEYFLDIHNDYVSFLRRSGLNIDLAQKHLTEQELLIRNPICELGNNELAVSATISNEAIVMFTVSESAEGEFNSIRTYYKNFNQCNKIDLGLESVVGEKFIKDGILYYTVARENGNFGIVKRDIQSMTILDEINFESVFKVTVNNDQMLVFLPTDEVKVFGLDTFEEINSFNVSFQLINQNLGFFETVIDENLMYFDIGYPQPNRISEGPATINLNNGNIQDGSDYFLVPLQDQLTSQFANQILTENYAVDLENNYLIFPTQSETDGITGGIIYTNFQGELIKFIPLESVPFAIVQRN